MRETDSLCLSYKMSVTGKLLYNKFCELRPDLVSGISPEILSEVCNESSTQPFLQWFCQNVSQANILSNDEIKMYIRDFSYSPTESKQICCNFSDSLQEKRTTGCRRMVGR